MEILNYKGFEGSAGLDLERNVCRGKLLHIDDVVTYESKSIDGLQKEFEEAVDDYIQTCAEIGKEPQKPRRGQFNVRVTSELHKAAVRRAVIEDTSLNDVVCKALECYLVTQFKGTTAVAAVAAQNVQVVGNIYKGMLAPSICDVTVLGQLGSTGITIHMIKGDHPEGLTGEKYWGIHGSKIEDFIEEQERVRGH